jgi:hypothetical protein
MRQVAGGEVEFDVIGYELLRSESLRIFPGEVATGLRAFAAPELQDARNRYAAVLREIVEDRFTKFRFDAIVVPSDTFFYVRSMPAAAHALGVPFLVAQKETTISEHTMREHAEEVRRFAPPRADRMTVCSERHKQFWVRAGGRESDIVVTGQPRFDFYSDRSRWPAASRPGEPGPSVLFLSYAVDAYHPDVAQGSGGWELLHQQTERGLHELARRGWRVSIKPHPQQSLDTLQRLRERAGELWGERIVPVDPQADVRPLIVSADVVVGFQSTALLEAMLAGRPVVYTGWDESAAALGGEIIPFEQWEPQIAVVREAEGLPDAVIAARGQVYAEEILRARKETAERYLGPLDGLAAERTLAILSQEATRWAEQRGEPEMELRERLARRRPPLRLARRGRAWSRAARQRVGRTLGR